MSWSAARSFLVAASVLAGCVPEPVVCEPACTGETPHCDPWGRCVACLSDADCGDEMPACATAVGLCVECSSDAHCEPGFRCEAAVCVADCPLPYAREREPDGGCGGCVTDADCAGGACRDRYCQLPSCADAPDPDAYCFLAAIEDLPTDGCQLHDVAWTFGWGNGCDGGRTGMAPVSLCDPCYRSLGGCADCTDGGECRCEGDADCPAPTVCDDGVCAHAPCMADDDCPCGQYCDQEHCRRECASDADCIRGRCHEPSGRCLDCLEDADCPAGWRCYENGCVAPCTIDPTCDGSCTDSGRCSGCEQFGLGVDPTLAPSSACEP